MQMVWAGEEAGLVAGDVGDGGGDVVGEAQAFDGHDGEDAVFGLRGRFAVMSVSMKPGAMVVGGDALKSPVRGRWSCEADEAGLGRGGSWPGRVADHAAGQRRC